LWIKPDRKISDNDMMNFMRDHLEGTPLDMRKDVGAGPFGLPYRWRPLDWKIDTVKNAPLYCNERTVATQQTVSYLWPNAAIGCLIQSVVYLVWSG